MKKLTHATIIGLKKHRRTELSLAPLTVLMGPNGAGKSTVRQAIELAILGYVPEIGKKLEYSRRLIQHGRDKATIGLAFSDGFGIERTIGKSTDLEVQPARNEATLDQLQARVDAETGGFVLSFDFASFLEKSAEKRREFLLGELPRDLVKLDEERFREWLGYSDAEEPIQKAIDVLWMEHVVTNRSLADGLQAAIDHTNQRKNEAVAKLRDQTTVSEAADRDAVTASTLPEQLDPQALERAQTQLEAVQQEIGELQQRRETAEQASGRYRRHLHDRGVAQARLDKATEEIAAIDVELQQPAATEKEIAALEEEVRRAEVKARSQQEAVTYTAEQFTKIETQIAGVQERLNALEGHAECPTCGAIAELPAIRESLQNQMQELERLFAAASGERTSAIELQDGFVQAMNSARNELAAARRKVAERLDAETRRGLAISRRDSAKAQLDAIQVAEPPAFSDADIERLAQLSAEASRLRGIVKAQQDLMKSAGEAEGARKRADAERERLDKLQRRVEGLKALHGSLQKLRAHVIQELVTPIEGTANEILQAIDPSKQFRFLFEREGKADFDFGFEEAGVFRSYDAASTGEPAFLAAVLVAALIAAIGPAWRVLIIERAESIDDARRFGLMRALHQLRDRFDNVILAGCCQFAEAEGWQIVDVAKLTGSPAVVAGAAA